MPHRHSIIENCGFSFLRTVMTSMLVVGMLAPLAPSAELSPDECTFLQEHFTDVVKVEHVRVDDESVQAVFSVPVYQLELAIADGSSGASVIIARCDEKLVCISRPSTDADCPELQKMINPAFALRTEDDARVFQRALDVLYPVFGMSEKEAVKFRRSGNGWIFVRGTFFEDEMGFVVTTDDNHAITAVSYALRLPTAT